MSVHRSHHTHYNGVVVETTESYEADNSDKLIIVSPEANPALGTPVQIILPFRPRVGASITIVATDRKVTVRSEDTDNFGSGFSIPPGDIFTLFSGSSGWFVHSSAIVPPLSSIQSAFSKAGGSTSPINFITPAEGILVAIIRFDNGPGESSLSPIPNGEKLPIFISATASVRALLNTLPETIDVFANFRVLLTRAPLTTSIVEELLTSFSFNLRAASNNASGANQNGSGAGVARIVADSTAFSISLRMSLSSSRDSDGRDTHINVSLDPNQNNASLYAQVMRR